MANNFNTKFQNTYFDVYAQKIIMTSDTEKLGKAAKQLGLVISGDRGLADNLELNHVQRLLEISANDYREDIKHGAIYILSCANFDKYCSLRENKVMPLFVKLMFGDYILSAREKLSLETMLWKLCRPLLTIIVARVALEISEVILQNPRHSYRNKARACYVLTYLSYKNQVLIKQETSDILVDFIYCGNPMLAGSALGVVENIVRWGKFGQVQYYVQDTKLLRCLGNRMLCCGYKKFWKQACQIISKMEAAWALFNGINEYTHGQIDEYAIENDNCESI